MTYHGTVYTNKELRSLLLDSGIFLEDFILSDIKGKPAKTKGRVKVQGTKVVVFGSDFIAKGFIRKKM